MSPRLFFATVWSLHINVSSHICSRPSCLTGHSSQLYHAERPMSRLDAATTELDLYRRTDRGHFWSTDQSITADVHTGVCAESLSRCKRSFLIQPALDLFYAQITCHSSSSIRQTFDELDVLPAQCTSDISLLFHAVTGSEEQDTEAALTALDTRLRQRIRCSLRQSKANLVFQLLADSQSTVPFKQSIKLGVFSN